MEGQDAELGPSGVPRLPGLPLRRACRDDHVAEVRRRDRRLVVFNAGSLAIPLTQLEKRIDEVPRDRHLIVHCAGGYRSSVAASVLALVFQVSTTARRLAPGFRHWMVNARFNVPDEEIRRLEEALV